MSEQPTPTDLVDELIALHQFKDRKYQDAWRKRGELIGIFSNIARKYDRLVVAQSEGNPDEAEPRADTAADLCVYSIKYITWLIEHDATAAATIAGADANEWSGTRGHRAVATALVQLAAAQTIPPRDLAAAFAAVAEPFATLERILVDQQSASLGEKAALGWNLAAASLAYLWRLALDEPAAWQRFIAYVADPA
jgi:hypothetical protein